MTLSLLRIGVLNQRSAVVAEPSVPAFDWVAHLEFLHELVAASPEPYAAYWDVAAPGGTVTPEAAEAVIEGDRVAVLPNLITGSPIGDIVFPNEPSFLTFQHIYGNGQTRPNVPAVSTALLFPPSASAAEIEAFMSEGEPPASYSYLPTVDFSTTELMASTGFTVAFVMSMSAEQAAVWGLELPFEESAMTKTKQGQVVVIVGSDAGTVAYVNGELDETITLPAANAYWSLSTLASFMFLFGAMFSTFPFSAFQRCFGMPTQLNEAQIIELSTRLKQLSE